MLLSLPTDRPPQREPDTMSRRSRPARWVRAAAWSALVLVAFSGGAGLRATTHAVPSAGLPASVRPGTPESGRAEMIALLEQRYFRSVDPQALIATAVGAYPTLLDDPYTHFLDADQYQRFMTDENASTVSIGVDVVGRGGDILLTRVFPNSPADQAGLREGDLITKIDARTLVGHTLAQSMRLLRGAADSTVTLEVKRDGSTYETRVIRRVAATWMVDSELSPSGGHRIGYVALLDFSQGVGSLTRAAVRDLLARGADRLVLDLRGNPGGWAKEAVNVASVFLADDTPVLIERSVHFEDTTYSTHDEPVTIGVPMVVLVDGLTASSAEIVAGALHDSGRATLMGVRTFGKGRIQDVCILPTGGAFKFTIAEYLTPNGYALDRVGIAPDVRTSTGRFRGVDVAYLQAVARLIS